MLAPLLIASLAAAADSSALPDTAEAPASPVVRRFEEVVVRASPLHDILSSQSVQLITRESLRELPVDRLLDAVALKAGVIARGEDLHVRGGRAGETLLLLEGIPLNEPLRGRPMELPFLALESAELLSGGLDAEHGGALAGVLRARTVAPGERISGEARWESDGWVHPVLAEPTRYDRVSGRLGGPVWGGLGAVFAADVLTDDTWLPALRSRRGPRSWRADNRILEFFKLAPVGTGSPWALDVVGSRRVERPFNPLWSLDGYTTTCSGFMCSDGPAFSPDPIPGYERFVGPDRSVMTDEHRLAAVLSGRRKLGPGALRGAASWLGSRRLTSVGGRDDEWYLESLPIFGRVDSPINDPLLVYHGYEPFFRKSRAETSALRADYERAFASGSRHGLGAGITYEAVSLRELDTSVPRNLFLDSLRAFEAYAPGGFAYGQGRWIHEGLVLNGGLRLEYFTAGPQAETQSFGEKARPIWSLAPRLGVAYPVSTRDVVSLSYVRINQPPPREFLYENRVFIDARRPLGNPGLEPSTVISYQIALKHLFERGRALQASIFYRDLFGQIGARDFDPGPGGVRRRYENADRGHAEGFELGLFWPSGETGRLELQYTFLHAVGTQSEAEGLPFGQRVGPGRVDPIGDHPLDWDRRHSLAASGVWRRALRPRSRPPRGPLELVLAGLRGSWSLAWITRVGSELPWTPSPRRELLTDLALVNSRRLGWEESTSLSARWTPWLGGSRISFGLEARNLFDFRSERTATLVAYPHPLINTYYDDYGAYREETGLPGGAYWDSADPSSGAWVPVHDPRLLNPPRLVRLSVGASF